MLALVPEDPDAQVHRGIAALHVARATTDPEALRWVPALLHNIGMALVDRGDLVEAESVLTEALHERRQQRGDPQEVRWAEESLADVRARRDRPAADPPHRLDDASRRPDHRAGPRGQAELR